MKLGKDPETNHLEFTDNPPQSSFDGVVWVKAWREEAWERIRGEEIYIGYSQLSEKSFTVKKKKKKESKLLGVEAEKTVFVLF